MTLQWLRTPEECFENLDGYPFEPHYVDIPCEGKSIRMHYIDEHPLEGNESGETVLLLHGQPSWSYVYRKVIPLLVAAGHRVVAPDLIGFGKSDKPSHPSALDYARQEEWLRTACFDILDLKDITVFMQDWGGLLGLRLVAFHPDRFARAILSNSGLPVGGKDSNFLPDDAPRMWKSYISLKIWQTFAKRMPVKMVGKIAEVGSAQKTLTDEVKRGHQAPHPSKEYMAGPRAMPQHVPTDPTTAASKRNRQAWHLLMQFDKPFMTAFSSGDIANNILAVDKILQDKIPGARNVKHTKVDDAGHFLQEDQPAIVAKIINSLIRNHPSATNKSMIPPLAV